eukprot:COSAG06_NODE_25619_length_632_cov_1.446529_1_plen_94_part_10
MSLKRSGHGLEVRIGSLVLTWATFEIICTFGFIIFMCFPPQASAVAEDVAAPYIRDLSGLPAELTNTVPVNLRARIGFLATIRKVSATSPATSP